MKPEEKLAATLRSIDWYKQELDLLRLQRDEARRLVCLVISLELKTTVNDVAANMGWKCLFEAAINN
jgi:hypothetical protein